MIERQKIGNSKSPHYRLIIDGVDVGTVHRKTETMPGGRRDRFWLAANRGHLSQDAAELALIKREKGRAK